MSQQQSNKTQLSQSTQTDFSYINLLEKIQEKDSQISKLQKSLIYYKSLIRSPNQPTIPVMKARLPDHPILDQFLSSSKPDPSFPPSSKSIPHIASSQLEQGFSKYSREKRPKLFDSVTSIKKIYGSQRTSKSSKKILKDNNLISDLLYSQDSSSLNWNRIMNEFRHDSNLFKQVLDSEKPSNRSGSAKQRPVSIKRNKHSAGKRNEVEVIDWSQSELDGNVTKNEIAFKSGNDYLSNNEIEEVMRDKVYGNDVIEKGEKTFEKLKEELMLPKKYMKIQIVSRQNIELILYNCLSLFKVRALVVKILVLIHQREDLVLSVISSEENYIENDYQTIEKIGKEIIQTIAFLRHTKFPIREFIYLGENYESKILKDNQKFKSLFPEVKSIELFENINY